MKVAFLGLGVMGFPMAGHISKGSCSVTVYNRNPQKVKEWLKKYKGIQALTIIEAVQNADIVLMCLGKDEDVRNVCCSEIGVIQNMKKNAILIDHTTVSAQLAQELAAQCHTRHIDFLDAPISGGQSGAEKGALTIMVGGKQETLEKAETVLSTYGKSIVLVGDVGSGQKAKMINQICIAGIIQGLSEGINFGLKANLDISKVLQAISHGAAQSWQMDNRGKSMSEDRFNFGFAIEWMIKDLHICIDEAQRLNCSLPITTQILEYYHKLEQQELARLDTSALIKLL